MGDNHAVVGAIPTIQTITPLFQGWDAILRRSMAEVQILSVAPSGPMTQCSLGKKALRRIFVRNSYATVWDVFRLQIGACSVRFAGGVPRLDRNDLGRRVA